MVRPLEQRWRKQLTPPERLDVVTWAERNLYIPFGTAQGYYRLALTPYHKGVFEAFQDPSVERINLCFAAQTAKTTACFVLLGYATANDPDSILWVTDTTANARSLSQSRLQPIFQSSRALSAELTDDADDFTAMEYRLRRCTVNLVGSNSPGNLASRSVRYLFADEVDKFPAETKNEGSALALGIRRTQTYWNRKVIVASTPTLRHGEIWTGLLSGDWREFYIPCPHCGTFQVMRFPNIRKPADCTDFEDIRRLAWYECAKCGGRITNTDKPALLAKGEWRAKPEPVTEYNWQPKPKGSSVVSFHLPAWYAPWVRFGDVLAEFIRAKPQPEQLKEVINSVFAEPWAEFTDPKSEDEILRHRSEYGLGLIPEDCQKANPTLILTCDVQKSEVYYTVRAWGKSLESWLIDAGILPDVNSIDSILNRQYGDHIVKFALIDATDGNREAEIYDFCRQRKGVGVYPLKSVGSQSAPFHWTNLDRMPNGEAIVGALRRVTLDSKHFSWALWRRWSIKRGDPGYWHLASDTELVYARHLTAESPVEVRDRARIHTEWRQHREQNHWLDCEKYNLAAAHIIGAGMETIASKAAATAPTAKPKPPPGQIQFSTPTGGFAFRRST